MKPRQQDVAQPHGGAKSRQVQAAEPRGRVWTAGLGLLLIGTLGAYVVGRLAAHTLLLPARLSHPEAEHAPALVGRTVDEARREAESAAGGLDVLGVAYSADVDSGEVLFQYPPEGLPLEPGKPIEVVVSAGVGRRRMPDMAGLPEGSVMEVLKQAGVASVRLRMVAEPGAEKGTVVGTAPAAGSALAAGDSVVVSVSRGGDIIEVPNLLGKTLEEATSILESAQLRVGKTQFAEGEDSGEVVVVGQDPPGGGLGPSGGAVDLRLGKERGAAQR